MENHFTQSGEATIFNSQFFNSFHGISGESLLLGKLFSRAFVGFNRESALRALPNTHIAPYWGK